MQTEESCVVGRVESVYVVQKSVTDDQLSLRRHHMIRAVERDQHRFSKFRASTTHRASKRKERDKQKETASRMKQKLEWHYCGNNSCDNYSSSSSSRQMMMMVIVRLVRISKSSSSSIRFG